MTGRLHAWRQARAVLLLPVMVTVVVPALLVLRYATDAPIPAWVSWPLGSVLLLAGLA